MKEVNDIKWFVLILSAGSFLYLIGNLPFKFIALYILEPEDYSIFSLTIQSFLLTIQIAGLQLHSPLTREIRLNKSSNKIIDSYAFTYWVTGVIGFIILFIIGNLFLTSFSLIQLLFFSLTLISFAFTELFIAIVRSKRSAVKLALIAGIPGIIRGLIVIPFIFNIKEMLTLNGFVYLYCISIIGSFILGAFFSKPGWKSLIFSLKNVKYREELSASFKNMQKGFLISIHGLLLNLGNWMLVFFAIKILDPITFKIFDLCLSMISILWIFSVNLSVSALALTNMEKQKTNKKMYYLILIGVIITLGGLFIIELIPLDLILSKFLNLTLTEEGRNIIRISVFIPLPMFIMSFLNGKIQALGKYKNIAFSAVFAFLGLLSIITLGYVINLGILLLIGLIIADIITIILFYYYIYYYK